MAINGKAEIFIEPDEQYTVVVTQRTNDPLAGRTLVSTGTSMTLAAAFDKAKIDLAALATLTAKHREIIITTRIE